MAPPLALGIRHLDPRPELPMSSPRAARYGVYNIRTKESAAAAVISRHSFGDTDPEYLYRPQAAAGSGGRL